MERGTRRNGVVLIMPFIVVVLAVSCTQKLPDTPNIILITTDYQAWEDVPEITPVLQMPAVDRLYNEGLVFQNHYCTAPVCMPSRYTIVSGTYPHTHGMWDNGVKWLPDNSPVLMNELKKAGYKTIGIGKMHFKPWDRMAGFDERIIADCQGNSARDTAKQDDYYFYLKKAGKTRFDYLKYQDSTDLYGVNAWPMDDTLDIDYFVGEETVRYIDEGKLGAGPWFLWISFNGPHNPWDPPEEYMNYYLGKELPPARYKDGEIDTKPYAHTITRFNYTRKLIDQIDKNPEKREENIHRIRAGHYGGLTWIDNQIDRIFAKLEEKDRLDNTLVIYTSDHGTHLGDHDLIHKGTHYERSSHVPFVIWWPGVLKPGIIDGFTSHVDLFPTLIDLAGGSLPAGLEGKSYYDVIAGNEQAPDTAIIEIIGNTALVTKDYKYGMYRQFREDDLYDRKKDPFEFINLAGKTEYQELVQQFRNYLFKTDPTLEEEYGNAPAVVPLPTSVILNNGETINGFLCPYLGRAGFTVKTEIETVYGSAGPILTHYEGPHGFSLFLDKGILKAGFRKWNEDQVISLTGIGAGKNTIEFTLRKDGILELILNGNNVGKWKTNWPKPVQPGRKEYITGIICAGSSGPNWSKPIGNYEKGTAYTGELKKIIIELSEENTN